MSNSETIRSDGARHAEEVLHAILKAKKNLRLYPENNPIYVQTAKETYKKLMKFFDYAGSMDLIIGRNEIKLGDEVVFTPDGKEENLALFFFRDGLRSLSIDSGLMEAEFIDFMEVISKDYDSEGVDEDLVSLLWEKDFRSITYKIDDSELVDEDENYMDVAEQQARKDANEEGNMQRAYSETVEHDEPFLGIVPITVSDEDISELEKEIDDDRKSKFPKLTDILFDMLYSSDSLDEFRDVTEIISNAAEFCIRFANLAAATTIFRKVGEVHERTKTPEAKAELQKLLSFAGSPSLIKTIGEWLDSKKGINEAVFKEYVSILGPSAIPHFIALLGQLKTISARKAAIYALTATGRKDFKALAKGLNDDRWFVVRNILVAFRSIGDRRAVDYLPKVVKHPEPRVRKEAIKLLGELGGPAAVMHIREHLYSSEISVAVVAAQALSKIGSETAKVALLEKITSKGFQDLELSAMKPFFEALARFKVMDVFDFLMKMLDKSPFLGRAKYNELKACAMYALGLMGSSKALPALKEQAESKDTIVRDYAMSAMKRIQNVQRQ